jgi:hypothetical protein
MVASALVGKERAGRGRSEPLKKQAEELSRPPVLTFALGPKY